MLDGPLTAGKDRGGEPSSQPGSKPSVDWGDGVEVLDEDWGRAPMYALAEACALIS